MICTFECTFCRDCVDIVLQNVCPNCGGGFEKRPVRPKRKLDKYPASDEKYIQPVNRQNFEALLLRHKDTSPEKR